MRWKRVFINASCMRIRTILKQKKPKAKIAQCSGMGKFCPPAAALPESPRGNTYAANSCAIRGGGGGGEVIDKIGRGAHLPCPKLFSCFWALFLKAREAPLKKRKRSDTARPQFRFWIKIRVNPIYLVIFFMAAPPIGNCNVHVLICDGVIDVSATQLHLLLLWLNKWCSSKPLGSASGPLVGKE